MLAGEKELLPSRPSAQPGGRSPAPGQLGLVQSFINTHYDLEVQHGAELLHSPEALADWLDRCGLIDGHPRLGPRDVQRALALREGLRSLARANGDQQSDPATPALLNEAAAGARVEIRFTASGPRFVPADGGVLDGAIGRLLAITATAMIDGSFSRLKVCPGEGCGWAFYDQSWAFYDQSRNQVGRWCAMSVCGGRAKARAHYLRRRGTGRSAGGG